MSDPRVVLQFPDVRVVCVELPDPHGVFRTEYIIEVTEPKAKDAMGIQQWKRLTDKSAWTEWMTTARRFLDELLKAAGEAPHYGNHRDSR
jgi:hypothetical protein